MPTALRKNCANHLRKYFRRLDCGAHAAGCSNGFSHNSRFAQQKLPVQRRAPAFTVTLLRQERLMDVTLFNRMLPHLKSCGMDEQAIARARESWAAAWEHDRRGLPCPFCSGQGRKGFAAAGFTEDNVKAAELMKCKSCGNVIPLDTR
jgi:hypothetical protein